MDNSLQSLKNVVENIEKVIVGKKNVVELVVISLICSGHILIEDVPGVGKTSLASAVAKSINASFKRIQFTPDVLPSDITGLSIYNRKTGEFEYRPGAIMSQLILADEINRTSPKTQASLLEVMEENQVTVDGTTYKIPQPFMVLATQNPIEYLGTFPLPEAQIDRFFMKISLGYPSSAEEFDIVSRFRHASPLESLQAVVDSGTILSIQEEIKNVYVDPSLISYLIDIVRKTREHGDIELGSSPRGSLSLFRASQAWAFYSGRNYVIPDDIKKMAVPVLLHRIILKQEAKLRKLSPADMLTDIINKINVPVVDYDEVK